MIDPELAPKCSHPRCDVSVGYACKFCDAPLCEFHGCRRVTCRKKDWLHRRAKLEEIATLAARWHAAHSSAVVLDHSGDYRAAGLALETALDELAALGKDDS